MKVLIFGAHPDDIEFSMGGTLAKLAEGGHDIAMAVMTRGEAGTHGTPELRMKEAGKAAELIGAGLEFLGFADSQVEDNYKGRESVAAVIRKHKPDIVFSPYYENKAGHHDTIAHSDHTTTGQIVRHALRLAKFRNIRLDYEHHFVPTVIYYMVPRSIEPTFICNISGVFGKWTELAKCHESQVGGVLDKLITYKKYYGSLLGCEYGEPFIVDRPLELDLDMFKKE